ncbi:MAG: hypothetical protein QME77_08260 [bacterium]|nr:hypothetical protein [bacterium]
MQQYASIVIAASFALLGLLPLAGSRIRRPLLWLCLLGGVAAGFFAREATKMAWDWVGPIGGLERGPAGLTINLLIAALVGEILKATGPLVAISLTPADAVTGLAYGAASGAGFGLVAGQQFLAMALGLVGTPFITPLSTAVAVVAWFFPTLAHIVTTAYLIRAGVRGGLGLALLFVVALQTIFGLAQKLPLAGGIPTGVLLTAAISLWLLAHLWRARLRAGAQVSIVP